MKTAPLSTKHCPKWVQDTFHVIVTPTSRQAIILPFHKSISKMKIIKSISISGIILFGSMFQTYAQQPTDNDTFLNNLIIITANDNDTYPFQSDILFISDYTYDEIWNKTVTIRQTSYTDKFGAQVLSDKSSSFTMTDYNPETNQFSINGWSIICDNRDSLFTKSEEILIIPPKSASLSLYTKEGEPVQKTKVDLRYDPNGRITNSEVCIPNRIVTITRYNSNNRISQITTEYQEGKIVYDEYSNPIDYYYGPVIHNISFNWKNRRTIKSITHDNTTHYYQVTETGPDGHWTSMIEYYFDKYGKRINTRLIERTITDPSVEREIFLAKKQEERKRKAKAEAEERRRKAIAEAKRKVQIDSLMSLQSSTVFSIKELDPIRYRRISDTLNEKITSVINNLGPNNLNCRIEDKIRIDYNGKTVHDIEISGDAKNISENISETLRNYTIVPETISASGLDTAITVTTYDTYIYEYTVSSENEDIVLVKNKKGIRLKKGNPDFYSQNSAWINKDLTETGVYHLETSKKEINGQFEYANYLMREATKNGRK